MHTLLSKPARARTMGSMVWKRRSGRCHEGGVEVSTVIVTCNDGRLTMRFTEDRPWEVHLTYLTNGVAVRRACINAKHAGFPFGSHVHAYIPATGEETCEMSDTLAIVPMDEVVSVAALKTVFHVFAGECAVEVDEACWTDPPVGR